MEYFKRRLYEEIIAEYPIILEGPGTINFLPDYAREVFERFSGVELGDDFQVLDLGVATQQNAHLANERDSFSTDWAVFAFSGQGDFWLLNKHKDDIGFYDHNQESYSLLNVVSIELTIRNWVVLGDLFHQFDLLNENNPQAFSSDFSLKPDYRADFIAEIEAVNSGLFDRLPFNNL